MERLNLFLSDPPVLRHAVIKTKNHTTRGSHTYEVTERYRNYTIKPMILLFA
jgi:hypothetical protein